MRTWEFDLLTDRDLTDEADADRIFELFADGPLADVTPAVSVGVPLLMCSVESPDLLSAVRQTIERLSAAGVTVLRVQVEPEAVAA